MFPIVICCRRPAQCLVNTYRANPLFYTAAMLNGHYLQILANCSYSDMNKGNKSFSHTTIVYTISINPSSIQFQLRCLYSEISPILSSYLPDKPTMVIFELGTHRRDANALTDSSRAHLNLVWRPKLTSRRHCTCRVYITKVLKIKYW